ncbi:TRAP transporter small permease [Candidatus Palauibacter sp.]|uniref:TRAP transporter small permease n=1 Tax=Candidatus Palauibacter sp. TaxID=3101350 RepID=UPI003B015FE6
MTVFEDHRDGFARAEAFCGRLAAGFAVAGGIALAVLLGITVAEVFWRYVLNDSLLWIEDVSTMSLAVVVAAAVAYGAREGSHVCVNLIARFAGRRVTRVTDAIARLLGAGATAVAAYALFAHGSCGLPCGAMTGSVSIPHMPFYYALGASLAAYGLLLVSQLLLGLAVWNAEDPNEPDE